MASVILRQGLASIFCTVSHRGAQRPAQVCKCVHYAEPIKPPSSAASRQARSVRSCASARNMRALFKLRGIASSRSNGDAVASRVYHTGRCNQTALRSAAKRMVREIRMQHCRRPSVCPRANSHGGNQRTSRESEQLQSPSCRAVEMYTKGYSRPDASNGQRWRLFNRHALL
jgi:hypothetical protein